MLQERVVAIAADYADALLVFRRAQRTLLLLLIVMLLAQLAVFAAVQFNLLNGTTAATQPTAANWPHILHYLTVVTLFLAMIFAALLVVTLFLTIHVMLVGRLIGVSYVAKAFTLSIVVLLLLTPWQSLLVTTGLGKADPVLPGVLYTWREITERVPTAETGFPLVLYWARFAAWPLVAVAMLLVVQVRSGRGLKLALGEEELLPIANGDVEVVPVR